MKTRISLSVFLLLAIVGSLFAQVRNKKARELGDYAPATLRELAEARSAKIENIKNDLMIQNDIVPSRVRVVYEGNPKPLSQQKKAVIREWAARFAGAPELYTRPFETEVLFAEDGEKYSLVVRKEFVSQFEQVLKQGDTVDLFIIKLGSVKASQKWEPVLLVEKFVKP